MLYPFARAARAAVLLCSFALALPVAHSQDESATDAAELGRITVTGSHISRLDIEGPTPVLTVTRQDIERTGVMTVGELLQQLPIDNGSASVNKYHSIAFEFLHNETFAAEQPGQNLFLKMNTDGNALGST